MFRMCDEAFPSSIRASKLVYLTSIDTFLSSVLRKRVQLECLDHAENGVRYSDLCF
jgi:hypothetical protein